MPYILEEDVEEFEVEIILDHCYKHRLDKETLAYLVKWLSYDQFESTWEPEENIGSAANILGKY